MSEVSDNAMTIIAVLVERLGGAVILTDEECYRVCGNEVLSRRTATGDLEILYQYNEGKA